MGMGITLISSAGPCYVIEVSHPAYRGVVVALYNVFWLVSLAMPCERTLIQQAGWCNRGKWRKSWVPQLTLTNHMDHPRLASNVISWPSRYLCPVHPGIPSLAIYEWEDRPSQGVLGEVPWKWEPQ